MKNADIAQSVERILGKDEVTSSNLVISSMQKGRPNGASFLHCVVENGFDCIGVPDAPRGTSGATSPTGLMLRGRVDMAEGFSDVQCSSLRL